MATRKGKDDKPRNPLGDVSKDHPRTLERVTDGAKVHVTDPLEFASLTTAHGYRDITGGSGSGSSRKGSTNVGTGSGTTEATGSTGVK